MSIKVKNFASLCYGIFSDNKFISTIESFDNAIATATTLANEGKKITISTIIFSGTEDDLTIVEGIVIMSFTKISDTVIICNHL